MNDEPTKRPVDGEFYSTKTLLSCDPDINRRTIRCWPSDDPVCTMNDRMRPWTAVDEKRLRIMLDALNKAREEP